MNLHLGKKIKSNGCLDIGTEGATIFGFFPFFLSLFSPSQTVAFTPSSFQRGDLWSILTQKSPLQIVFLSILIK